MQLALQSAPGACVRFASEEFCDFMREIHACRIANRGSPGCHGFKEKGGRGGAPSLQCIVPPVGLGSL